MSKRYKQTGVTMTKQQSELLQIIRVLEQAEQRPTTSVLIDILFKASEFGIAEQQRSGDVYVNLFYLILFKYIHMPCENDQYFYKTTWLGKFCLKTMKLNKKLKNFILYESANLT